MIRRLLRLLAATALVSGSMIPLVAVNAGAIIDTDEIEAAAAGASCTTDDADCISLAAAAPAIDLRGANNTLNEDQTNFGNIDEGDTIEIEGDVTTVDCSNNVSDSRASGGAISSTPNPNNGGFGQTTRCVGVGDHASLGDDDDVWVYDYYQDDDTFDCDASATRIPGSTGSGTDGNDDNFAIALCEEGGFGRNNGRIPVSGVVPIV